MMKVVGACGAVLSRRNVGFGRLSEGCVKFRTPKATSLPAASIALTVGVTPSGVVVFTSQQAPVSVRPVTREPLVAVAEYVAVCAPAAVTGITCTAFVAPGRLIVTVPPPVSTRPL